MVQDLCIWYKPYTVIVVGVVCLNKFSNRYCKGKLRGRKCTQDVDSCCGLLDIIIVPLGISRMFVTEEVLAVSCFPLLLELTPLLLLLYW